MLKDNESFKERLKERLSKSEEVEKIAREKINKLKDNSYFTNLMENRKKIKELNEKRYKLELDIKALKSEIEEDELEEGYQVNLQLWTLPITLDSFKHSFNENTYQKANYDFFQLFSPLVDISIELKERTDLKVWKFEVTSVIKNAKNIYDKMIKSNVKKFKTKEDALKLVEKLKQDLFNKYAEEFAELNQSIKLANEVKAEFEGLERNYLPNDLQRILKKVYR